MNRLVAVIALGGLPEGPPPTLPANALTQMGLALQNAALYAQQQVRLRRLSRAERLATAGELAASAAHEIRNPLTAISSAVQLLGEAFPAGNPRREVADRVMREIDRINVIVEGLLAFARPPETKREAVHLGAVVESAVKLVAAMARKAGIEVETRCEVERDVLRGDADQLTQVLVNLLLNGIQAMPSGGRLSVRLSRPNRLRVEIADTGAGMTPEQQERAFDPFYTTKEKGTGLGLPICYGIVRGHGGEIDIDSAPGRGTVVRVEF
ncbi:MAG: ATP-binding protein [Gemmatimonadota bacterium]